MLEREMEVAKAAVRAACRACAAVRSETDVDKLDKDDRSPVTVADYASQAMVAQALLDEFPADPLVAEEGSEALRRDENRTLLARVGEFANATGDEVLARIDRGAGEPGARFWSLDPVDGTKGFLRNEQYAVALALILEGRVVLGVLGCPNLPLRGHAPSAKGAGSLLWGVRGGGSWQQPINSSSDPEPLRVSGTDDIARVRLCESVESAHTRHDLAAETARELEIRAQSVRVDSQAKYALVGRGDAEIYWRLPTRPGYEEKIWDHAAGALVVEEAGGVVTDVVGKPLDFSRGRTLSANRGVLATHGPFHGAFLQALSRHFK
jgi:3'(2'), 5'-bisphosphate nucleotidase